MIKRISRDFDLTHAVFFNSVFASHNRSFWLIKRGLNSL
ncbi:Uncharacterised protein [Vibrio cholerae]|nr:Uncharacterised protein [Vibrio cholerae]CSI63702.1 Uncharacterised protein [Vibrio cholerae]